jgi:IS1 family transposase
MNQLSTDERVRVVSALIEGCSIHSIVRMTGVSKNTVVKLLEKVGKACDEYQDAHLRNLTCKRLQCDEIWSFVYSKQKNVPAEKAGEFGYGDVWTWVAMDSETKLVPTWLVGNRNAHDATGFIRDLASRLANKVQLTTDGLKVYLEAVEAAFGGEIDYAMLIKLYEGERAGEARYSPAVCTGCKKEVISGEPEVKHISTSHIERQNLTMRMSMRRFTRLTNAFSKKVANHEYAIALHYMHYNFCRVHQSLRVTPAMAAGVTSKLWEIKDIVAMID